MCPDCIQFELGVSTGSGGLTLPPLARSQWYDPQCPAGGWYNPVSPNSSHPEGGSRRQAQLCVIQAQFLTAGSSAVFGMEGFTVFEK